MCFSQMQDISVSDIRFGRDYSSLLFKMDIKNYQPTGPSKCYILEQWDRGGGGGDVLGGIKSPEKSFTKVYGSTLLAYAEVGVCQIPRKKCYITLQWPPIGHAWVDIMHVQACARARLTACACPRGHPDISLGIKKSPHKTIS